MNQYGPCTLKWVPSKLSSSVVMLDLIISINPCGRIVHSTYQKEMNLYAYVPYSSAHPPGMLRGLVISQLKRYWKQNTEIEDYQKYAALLYQRLRNRGYHHKDLAPAFGEAAQNIDKNAGVSNITNVKRRFPDNVALFHLTYHPDGVQNKDIHRAYNNNCNFGTGQGRRGINNPYKSTSRYAQHLGIDRLLIARSRPKNLHDLLCPSTLFQVPGKEVDTHL